MDGTESKFPQNPPKKTQKIVLGVQIGLRILVIATALAATWVMLTSRQSTEIFGITFDARYSYSSTCKFFAFANAVACAFVLLSLLFVLFFCRQGPNPSNHYYLFLHDLFMMSLVLAGCAAATAEGFIGRYGNSHAGWTPICDHFGKFCNKMTTSVILSYLSLSFLFMLTIISASKSRQIQVSSSLI
ncbi:CASP-like protein 1F1 [Corylus avellana]|uniref:CASP-like protein 1F1 n=1 Tax=Corylus avellana TaxID=13451 RepID=UPI001E20F575|nr:CASP-like protein 1F1 [Corylus avellana]